MTSSSDQIISTKDLEREISEIITSDQEINIVESDSVVFPSPLLSVNEWKDKSHPIDKLSTISYDHATNNKFHKHQHLNEGAFLLTCCIFFLIISIMFHKNIYYGLLWIWRIIYHKICSFKGCDLHSGCKNRHPHQHLILNSPYWQTLSPGNGNNDHLIDITRLRPLIDAEDNIRSGRDPGSMHQSPNASYTETDKSSLEQYIIQNEYSPIIASSVCEGISTEKWYIAQSMPTLA